MSELVMKEAADIIRRAAKFVDGERFNTLNSEGAEIRWKAVEEAWVEYKAAKAEVLKKTKEDDVQKLLDESDTVQENYFKSAAAYKPKINKEKPQDVEGLKINVQLPLQQDRVHNTWGMFDGDELKYQGFRDRFVAAVHSKDEITAAYKFQFLKGSLIGDAARDFGDWEPTDEGYAEAWDRFNKMYDKKYSIRRGHLRKFLQLKEIQAPATKDELKKLSVTTHDMLRQLRANGLPVEYWGFFIVHCLHERLDEQTKYRWELERNGNDNPSAIDMLCFIDREAEAAPEFRRPSRTDNSTVRKVRDSSVGSARGTDKSTDAKKKVLHPCEVCTESHQIWDCPQFAALSLRSRREFVDNRNICPNCLKRGHKEKTCFQSKCVRCPGAPAHNILLCPTREVNKTALPAMRVKDSDKFALVRRHSKHDDDKEKAD